MDEPTSGLDPVSRRKIWKIIRKLKNEGKCIILTTHFLEEADTLADRIAILNRGKLLILGESHFIKKKFGEGYTVTLVS
jgi:ATP-binding cassette subfamily A (ABC1) protein 3